MGGNRRTRSSKPRGPSVPPSRSSATLWEYFEPPSGSDDGMDKMALLPCAFSTRPQQPPNSPPLLYPQSNLVLDWERSGLRSQDPGGVSPSQPYAPQDGLQHDPQDTIQGLTAASYTQCSEAYPCLLRMASDPALSMGRAVSPSPSLNSGDFSPLLELEYAQASGLPLTKQTGESTPLQERHYTSDLPQPQRQARHNIPTTTERGTDQALSYAQVTSSPNVTHRDGLVTALSSPSLRWGNLQGTHM